MSRGKLLGRDVISHLRKIIDIPVGARLVTIVAPYSDMAIVTVEYLPEKEKEGAEQASHKPEGVRSTGGSE